jgi:putative SOS response-associated peptidase YedK
MCGRYTLRHHNLESVKRELRADSNGGSYLWEPRYNIAPTDQVPILVRNENGQRNVVPMGWGIPRQRGERMVRQINTRAESVSSRGERSAVIADGFFEWAGEKGSPRQPYFCHRADDRLILIAGLWQWSQVPQGYQQTFTIVTTWANARLAAIHDRMPAILEGDGLALWLNPKTELQVVRALLAPAPDEVLELWKESALVNSRQERRPRAASDREVRISDDHSRALASRPIFKHDKIIADWIFNTSTKSVMTLH